MSTPTRAGRAPALDDELREYPGEDRVVEELLARQVGDASRRVRRLLDTERERDRAAVRRHGRSPRRCRVELGRRLLELAVGLRLRLVDRLAAGRSCLAAGIGRG